MIRRADVFFVAMAGLAAAGAMLSPATASAATECQSSAVTGGGGLTEDQAEAAWSAQVKQSLGAAWSSISLAKDEKVSEQNLALANLFFVTAYPCRTVLRVDPVITRPVPALRQQQ